MARYECDGTMSRVLSRYQVIYPVRPGPRDQGPVLTMLRRMNLSECTATVDIVPGCKTNDKLQPGTHDQVGVRDMQHVGDDV